MKERNGFQKQKSKIEIEEFNPLSSFIDQSEMILKEKNENKNVNINEEIIKNDAIDQSEITLRENDLNSKDSFRNHDEAQTIKLPNKIEKNKNSIFSNIIKKMSRFSIFPQRIPKSGFSFENNLNGPGDKSALTQKIKEHLNKTELSLQDLKNLIQTGAEKHGFWDLSSLHLQELAEIVSEDLELEHSSSNSRNSKAFKKLKKVFLLIFNAMCFISAVKFKIVYKNQRMEASMKNENNNLSLLKNEECFNVQNTVSKPSMVYFYKFLFLLATVLFSYLGFAAPPNKHPKAYAVLDVGMQIAFAGRIASIFLLILMFLLSFRDLLTFLRKITFLERYLVVLFNEHIELHKFCGYLLIIVSTMHAIGHLAGTFPRIAAVTDLDALNSVTTYGKFEKLPSYTDLIFRTIPGVSGTILLILLYLIGILSIDYFRKKCYQWFLNIHSLYVLCCVLLYVHGCMFLFNYGMPLAVGWISPFFIIALLHHLKKWLQAICNTPILDVSFSAKNSVAYIKILKPKFFGVTPGQYLFLNCPRISLWQWHPFSISSVGSNGVIKLMVKDSGDFTNIFLSLLFKAKSDYIVGNNIEALQKKNMHEIYYDFLLKENDVYDIVSKKKQAINIYPKINIYGPISAPAVGALHNKNVIFIGSGVGITPYLVFLDEYLNFLTKSGGGSTNNKKFSNSRDKEILSSTYRAHRFLSEIRINEKFQLSKVSNKQMKIKNFFKQFEKVSFYYVARDCDQLSWINYYILKLLKYNYDPKKFEIKLFLTTSKEKINNPENYIFWRAVEKYQNFKEKSRIKLGVDFLTNLPHPVIYKRPDFKKLFEDRIVSQEKENFHNNIYVYACGPLPLLNSIKEACNFVNKQDHHKKLIFIPEKFN